MKTLTNFRFSILFLLFLGSAGISAQVGIGTETPDESSILDVTSTDRGVLIPRLSSSQKIGISSPAKGLLVFDTNTNSFWYFDGTVWQELLGGGGGASPWNKQGTTVPADSNADDMYVMGSVAIGKDEAISGVLLDVAGAIRGGNADTLELVGANSLAYGEDAVASGDNSISLGYQNRATNYGAVAIGYQSLSSGFASTSFGANTQAMGDNSSAFGNTSKAEGKSTAAFGENTHAIAENAVAFGELTVAEGHNSAAFGLSSSSIGENSMASGDRSQATGKNASSFGERSVASGKSSSAFGEYTTASGSMSFSSGQNTEAKSFVEVAIGRYNISSGNGTNWLPSDQIFSIGNGNSSSNRSNALTVKKDGWMGIGVASKHSTERLRVDGSIRTSANTYADYVFEKYFLDVSDIKPDYTFKSLEEIKEFLEANHHLPGVTSIKDVELTEDGSYEFNITELAIQSLEKIEELFIHSIEQNEKTKALVVEMESLKSENQRLLSEKQLLENKLSDFSKRLEMLEKK